MTQRGVVFWSKGDLRRVNDECGATGRKWKRKMRWHHAISWRHPVSGCWARLLDNAFDDAAADAAAFRASSRAIDQGALCAGRVVARDFGHCALALGSSKTYFFQIRAINGFFS